MCACLFQQVMQVNQFKICLCSMTFNLPVFRRHTHELMSQVMVLNTRFTPCASKRRPSDLCPTPESGSRRASRLGTRTYKFSIIAKEAHLSSSLEPFQLHFNVTLTHWQLLGPNQVPWRPWDEERSNWKLPRKGSRLQSPGLLHMSSTTYSVKILIKVNNLKFNQGKSI